MKPLRKIVPGRTGNARLEYVLITTLATIALAFALPGLGQHVSAAFANAVLNMKAS